MTPHHHRLKAWPFTIAILGLLLALTPGHVGASRSNAHGSASLPTVYMIGSVTNNSFWAAVKAGFEQGGTDFHLRAIYEAPDVHTSPAEIALIKAAMAA